MASSLQIDFLSFLLSGQYTDFEIRVGPYAFRVHRLVLAASLNYFRTVFGPRFKEAEQGYVDLQDEQGPFIARLIEHMYTGCYSISEHKGNLSMILANAITHQAPPTPPDTMVFIPAANAPDWQIHAEVFTLADKYDYEALKTDARNNFLAVFGTPELSIVELIQIASKIYSNPPFDDSGLRKYVVHRAQLAMPEISAYPSFVELMKTEADFAFDFGTKYGARQHLWCPDCESWISVLAGCTCGLNGICGKIKLCKELKEDTLKWESLQCNLCKKKGRVLRDQPRDDAFCTETHNKCWYDTAGGPEAKKPRLK